LSGRPESLVFFTDRDLGKRFPEILSDAGLTVERHADHAENCCIHRSAPGAVDCEGVPA
jgi:hypothetical protein